LSKIVIFQHILNYPRHVHSRTLPDKVKDDAFKELIPILLFYLYHS
jgi:hypothetical protein